MSTISTSTQATPFAFPHASLIDRRSQDGALYCMLKNTAGNFELFRSVNNGVSWATLLTMTRANVQEFSSFLVDGAGSGYWAYRTYESGQDRIYTRRFNITSTPQIGTEVLLAAYTTGAAGNVVQGLDIQKVQNSSGFCWVVVAVGFTQGANHGVILYGETITAASVPLANNTFITNKRQWLVAGSGRIAPSLEIEHVGDGKSGAPAHLWCAWGRTNLFMVKLPWTGSGFAGPTTAQTIIPSGLAAQDSISARWDGNEWLMAVPDPVATDTVRVIERNRANSASIVRNTPAHPTGVVRNCTISYNNITRDFRVYAIGTSTTVLYYVDYIRATGSWSSWSDVLATAVIGTAGNQFTTRRSSFGNARYDVGTAHSTPTQIHTSQTLTYAPNVPTWQFGGSATTPPSNGAAMDVAASLTLDWTFSDPDPGDTQQSYSLSRQVGGGSLEYWRTSDNTWQTTEQVNTSGTTQLTLTSTQWSTDGAANGATDPPHTYKVKVRDSAGTDSIYSDPLVIIPSAKVNPSVTAPTPSQVLTGDRVTVSWTVSEQSAWRVKLQIFGQTIYDSGWVSGTATTHIPNVPLGDLFSYSVFVSTKNLEGLPSNEIQVNFSVDWIEPATGSLVLTPMPTLGVIRAAFTNPTPVGGQPVVASQRLTRRLFISPFIVNHDFETADLSGWGTPVGGSAARSSAQFHKGAWSYQLTPDGVTADCYVETVKIPCTQDVAYFADMFIRGVSATKGLRGQIRWYTAGDAFISASNSLLTGPPPAAGAWDFRWVYASPPPTAAKMTLVAMVTNTPGVGDLLHTDEVRVRPDLGGAEVIIVEGLPNNFTYDDFTVASDVEYEYRVETRSVIDTTVGGVWTQ